MEPINSGNITDEELEMLRIYANGTGTDFKTFQASGVLFQAAAMNLTMRQAQGNLPPATQLNYFDRKRWCGPNAEDGTVSINHRVWELFDLDFPEIPRPCFEDCYFGVKSIIATNARSRCQQLHSIAKKVIGEKENLSKNTETKSQGNFEIVETGPTIETELQDAILKAYNNHDLSAFDMQPIGMSSLGVSREVQVKLKSGKSGIISLSGIGIVSVEGNIIHIDRSNPEYSVTDYIQNNLPHTYTGMSTGIIRPDGIRQIVKNNEPLGAYSPAGAIKKWRNTEMARNLFVGSPDISVPKQIALLHDKQSKLAGVVYEYPTDMLQLSQLLETGRIENFLKGTELVGKALKILHSNNLVHAQPGGNWAFTVQNGFPEITMRDFTTMYSIADHQPKAKTFAMSSDIGSVIGAIIRTDRSLGGVLTDRLQFVEHLAFGYSGKHETVKELRKFVSSSRKLESVEKYMEALYEIFSS